MAGVTLGSQISEVADPEAATANRLGSQAASRTQCDGAATGSTAPVCVMPPGRALLDPGQVNRPKRIKLG